MKIFILTLFMILMCNTSYAKCYWLGYGANYKCYDETGKSYYMFGKKNGTGYYKKDYKSGEKADCKWINGNLKCNNF